MNKFYTLAISAICGLALSISAFATTYTYNFGSKMSGAGPASLNFASLTFDDVIHKFSLSFNDPTSSFGNSAFISALAVDYTGAKPLRSGVSGGVSSISVANANGNPNSTFDFLFKFGNGNSKLTDNEIVNWTSTNFDINKLGTSNSPLALHVEGIAVPKLKSHEFGENEFEDNEDGGMSGWYALSVSAVPEPETYAMLLAGLGLMGAVARRRRLLK
jgi:PEP-CTERM motif